MLGDMVSQHGIPVSFYSDRHNIFVSPDKDKLTIEEELSGKTVALTQFGRALEELGINHIRAHSPQAKGRVERLWGTLQARLTIELRLAKIPSCDDANAFLPSFIRRFNKRFAVAPAANEIAFRPSPPLGVLNRIACLKEQRLASNGSTMAFRGKVYHLLTAKGAVLAMAPRSKALILSHLDGTISALYNGQPYPLQELVSPVCQNQKEQHDPILKPRPKPAPTHPWRKSWKQRKHSVNPSVKLTSLIA